MRFSFKALAAFACLAVLTFPAAAKEAKETDVDEVPKFDAAPRPDDVAVIIGIEKYRDLQSSEYSARDAELFRDYLLALGYAPRNISLHLNERATRADLRKAFLRWLPNQVKPHSKVVVYYSGHGAPDPISGEAYLVPHDGDPNYLEDTAYPMKQLFENLSTMKSGEVMVLMDSCFSGAGGRSVLAKGARPLVLNVSPLEQLSSKIAVMTASQAKQISSSSKDLRHGIFTYHLLKALRLGKKSFAAIYEHVKPLVENDAKSINIEQSPNLTPAMESGETRFLLADFTRIIIPEKPKPEMSVKDQKTLEAEREKMRKEMEQLRKKQQLLQEEAERKEKERQEAADRRERERQKELKRQREEMDRENQERERKLKAEEKRLEKLRRKKQNIRNLPPPP